MVMSRKERPMGTLVIGVLLGGVGLVMLLAEAISFAGWIAGNRMLASFVALLLSILLLSVELFCKIKKDTAPAVPTPQRRHTDPQPAVLSDRQSSEPAVPPPLTLVPVPVPAPVSEKVMNGDKSFMAKASTAPSWAKASRDEAAAALVIGPQ
jgi:hypothetical protein